MKPNKCSNCLPNLPLKTNEGDSFDRRSVIVATENKKTYRCSNPLEHCIGRIRVDGGLINDKSQNKCDFLVFDCDLKKVILIELKGKNLDDAAEQILSTLEILKSHFNGFEVYARIILSKFSNHQTSTTNYKKLVQKFGAKNIICKVGILEEYI